MNTLLPLKGTLLWMTTHGPAHLLSWVRNACAAILLVGGVLSFELLFIILIQSTIPLHILALGVLGVGCVLFFLLRYHSKTTLFLLSIPFLPGIFFLQKTDYRLLTLKKGQIAQIRTEVPRPLFSKTPSTFTNHQTLSTPGTYLLPPAISCWFLGTPEELDQIDFASL